MRRFSIYILLLCILSSCIKQEEHFSKGKAIITGEILNSEAKVLSLEVIDMIGGVNTYSALVKPESGEFEFEVDLFYEHDIILRHKRTPIQFLTGPGDSNNIIIDASTIKGDYFEGLIFTGSNARDNEEINHYLKQKVFSNQLPNYNNVYVKHYIEKLTENIDIGFRDLNRYIEKHNPSKKFITWAKANIIYSNANSLVHYHAFGNMPKTDSLFTSEVFSLNLIENSLNSGYHAHLNNTIYIKYGALNASVSKAFEDNDKLKATRESILLIKDSDESDIVKDLMIFHRLDYLLEGSLDDFKKIWHQSENLINDEFIRSELDSKFNDRRESAISDNPSLSSVNSSEKNLIGDLVDDLFIKSANKILYVDLWATWCGPCNDAIPYWIELNEYFKNEDKIEFVSICMESIRTKWKAVLKHNNLPGTHYFLNNDQSAAFRGKLNFTGYPTYMIICDGKIIDPSAKSPSDKELVDELVKMLKD